MLALRFDFLYDHRPQLEAILQDIYSDLMLDIEKLHERLTIGGIDSFSTEDLMVEANEPIEDQRQQISHPIYIKNMASGWWAYLETGLIKDGLSYLRVHSDYDAFNDLSWNDLGIKAFDGKAEMHIDARGQSGDMHDPFSIIDFVHPMRKDIKYLIRQLFL